MHAPLALLGSLAALALTAAGPAQPDLAKDFASPPRSAAPHTWWHWMNGNITAEGITADLEAMKQIGLGGAQIFNVSESIPPGPILFNSPEWRALFKHAAAEADRLGLELCMHNCAGWSSSGGPWITPDHAMQMVVFAETTLPGSQHAEITLPKPEAKENFYRDIAILAFPTPADSARIKDLRVKGGWDYRYGQDPAPDAYPDGAIIPRDSLVNLTSDVDESGKLTWDAPASPTGSWTILRIGHTPTGARNAPSPDSGRGLECDKLSKAGLDAHWNAFIAPLLAELGPLAPKALNNILIDSYEMGGQNWTSDTAAFRTEFKNRRGYDLLPYLPVLTGRIVGSAEISERFLWDFRRTIADLFADNYYSHFAELCKKAGLKSSIEPYDGPFECLLSGRDAAIPMGEFWVGGGETDSCKLAASVGHTYGQPIIGAESFTAEPGVGRWLNHPYSLKGVGDLMYASGINRYIIHRYAHQPWVGDKAPLPGMTMGQWGTHFERTTTWWSQGSAWVQYLTRCQYLLQQGRPVADVLFLAGDAAPNGPSRHPELKALGYDYDSCNPDVLLRRISVKNGRLVLPEGTSYRLLVLPETPYMTPATLSRLKDLARQGVTILGPRPTKSPSLSGYPACDSDVARLASELWGDSAGHGRAVGAGRIAWDESPDQLLAALHAIPDCQLSPPAKTAWIHRRTGDADIYFISSQQPRIRDLSATFRISGRLPELWRPDTGEIAPAPIWSDRGDRTVVSLQLDPTGSVFVVFRKPAAGPHLAAISRPAAEAAKPPKIEITRAVYEALDGAGAVDVTAKAAALAASGENAIPATNSNFGDPAYLHRKRLRIDYLLDGKPLSRTAEENTTLELAGPEPDAPRLWTVASTPAGPELIAYAPDTFDLTTSRGTTTTLNLKSIPDPIAVPGPWTVEFQNGRGAPPSTTLDRLASWTDNADPGIKYFSGTAEYTATLEISAAMLGPTKALLLDLGNVQNIAEVTLNDHNLGIWWKPPFSADIASIAKPGKNTLKVRVTNLWTNRLIGDEQFPEDAEWSRAAPSPLKKWPDWFAKGEPRPVPGRLTFTTWKHYTKNSPLLPSGLIGPVLLRPGERVKLSAQP